MRRAMSVVLLAVGLVSPAVAEDANTFKSASAGFEVTKPTAWQFISGAQTLENLRETKLNDEEFRQLMLKHANLPLVSMAKFPEPFNDLNPSVRVSARPYGGLKGATPQQIIEVVLPQFQKLFKDFRIVQAPTEAVVSGIKSGYVRFNYSLELADGRSFPATSELWIVPRGDYYFMIGAGTRQDEKTGSRKEIQKILQSVKIKS